MRHFNTLCLLLICAAFFTFTADSLFAQEKHGHEAPHGGIVATAGDYHFELVVVDSSESVRIYLLDSNEKTLPTKGVTGKVTFLFPDKSKKKADLMVHDEFFMTMLDAEKMAEFTAVVALKIKGKSQTGRFKYEAEDEHHGEEGDHLDPGWPILYSGRLVQFLPAGKKQTRRVRNQALLIKIGSKF